MTRLRIIRAVYAIAIWSARSDVGQIPMPDLVRVFREHHPLQLDADPVGLKVANFYLGGVCREDSEVCTTAIPRRSPRVGLTF